MLEAIGVLDFHRGVCYRDKYVYFYLSYKIAGKEPVEDH